jgi:hypothetical protein
MLGLLTTVIYDRYRIGKPSNHISAEDTGPTIPYIACILENRFNLVLDAKPSGAPEVCEL